MHTNGGRLTSSGTRTVSSLNPWLADSGGTGRGSGSFQDRRVSPSMSNGRCMKRLAHRVAAVMSVRPVRRSAPMARLRSPAMTWGPDLVLVLDSSSR